MKKKFIPLFVLIFTLIFAPVAEASVTTYDGTIPANSYAGSAPCSTAYPYIHHEINVTNTSGKIFVQVQYLNGGSWVTADYFNLDYWNTPYVESGSSNGKTWRVLMTTGSNATSVVVTCWGSNSLTQ